MTLRHVQGDLRPQASAGSVRVKHLKTDAEVIAWYRKVALFHESQLTARDAGLPQKDWFTMVEEVNDQGKVVRPSQLIRSVLPAVGRTARGSRSGRGHGAKWDRSGSSVCAAPGV